MPKPHLSEEPVELSERDSASNLARPASLGLLSAAQELYDGLTSGFPDISGKRLSKNIRNALKTMDKARTRLADVGLQELCLSLRDRVLEMVALDAEAVESIASYMGKTPLDRKKLDRYIRSDAFPRDFPAGAMWTAEPGYRSLRRRSLAAFDAAWLLDQQIAGRVRELVEGRGEVLDDVAARFTPIPRPVDQLRGSIESMRQEIKKYGALSERLTEIVTGDRADLPSDTDKDMTSP